jgi:hypothetical protein
MNIEVVRGMEKMKQNNGKFGGFSSTRFWFCLGLGNSTTRKSPYLPYSFRESVWNIWFEKKDLIRFDQPARFARKYDWKQ